MKISLSTEEMAALYGLPLAVICLYVMAIRPRMDYATGLVGAAPRISWHALTEWLYVEPHQGIAGTGSPSVQQVRRMARHLVRAGLIQLRSSEVHRQLVFYCPFAYRDSLAQNKADINPTDQPDRQADSGFHRGTIEKPTVKPTEQKQQKPTDTRSPKGTNNHHHHREGTHMGGGGGGDLIWPKNLTQGERSTINRMIEANQLNGSAQLLLDELQGAMGTKGVSNKVGYARRILQAMIEGKYTPERAIAVQEGRERHHELERKALEDAGRRAAEFKDANPSKYKGKLADILKRSGSHVER